MHAEIKTSPLFYKLAKLIPAVFDFIIAYKLHTCSSSSNFVLKKSKKKKKMFALKLFKKTQCLKDIFMIKPSC